VDLPTLSVRTQLPGASPEEVEAEISQRLEEAINTVEGIEELRSISSQGSSIIIVTFNLDATSTWRRKMRATASPPCCATCPRAPSRPSS
jgi:multidrug efflux pump subunit AcrB